MPILGQPPLTAQAFRPKYGNAATANEKRSAFEPPMNQDTPGAPQSHLIDRGPFASGPAPNALNPILPSAQQRGTPGQDNFANQGAWNNLARAGRGYKVNEPTPTGASLGAGIAGNTATSEAPQADRAQPAVPVMDRELPPRMGLGMPPQGGGQSPFAPAEQNPGFRGMQPMRFLGNPLSMTRTDQSVTDTMAGTRQPGRLPIGVIPKFGGQKPGGLPPKPSPMPVPRFKQPRVKAEQF